MIDRIQHNCLSSRRKACVLYQLGGLATFDKTSMHDLSDDWIIEWMDGWMDEWMMNEWWMDECMDVWMDGWMIGWMNDWMNEYEWMDGWMDGWMNEWVGEEWLNDRVSEWMPAIKHTHLGTPDSEYWHSVPGQPWGAAAGPPWPESTTHPTPPIPLMPPLTCTQAISVSGKHTTDVWTIHVLRYMIQYSTHVT